MRTSDDVALEPDRWPLRCTVLSGDPIVNLEVEYERADGVRFTLIVNSLSLTGTAGTLRGAVATYSNITAIRDLQRALRASDTAS